MHLPAGFPTSIAASPALQQDRAPPAVQALQAEAARGRTPGAGDATLTAAGIAGTLGSEKSWQTGARKLARPQDARPDPDAKAGPPPAFEVTPLEKLKYPPSPLEELVLSPGKIARDSDNARDAGRARADDPTVEGDAPATADTPARPQTPAYGHIVTTAGPDAHGVDLRR